MTVIRDVMHRVSKNPMEVAAAMAAGAFVPDMVYRMAPTLPFTQAAPALAGAATYYFMDDIQDATSMAIGGVAGYMGPMLARRVGM